jgi:glycosyltransferase 2 family protein
VARLGSGPVLAGLRAIDPLTVLVALGLGLLTTVLSAWRWCLVARGLGLHLPLRTAVADYYRGLFLNSVLPGGVLGDVQRAVSHGRQAGDVGRGVRAVALERTAGLAVSVVAGLLVLLTSPDLLAAGAGRLIPDRGVVGGLVVPLAAAVAVAAALGIWALRGPRAPRIRAALRTGLADARAGVFTRDAWPGVVLLSAAALAGFLALFVVAAHAACARAPLGELVPLLVPAWLAMALPVNVGGWGPREAVATVAFAEAGLGSTQGFTVAVVYGVLSLIACLPGGLLLLRRGSRQGRLGPGEAEVGEGGGDGLLAHELQRQ